LLWAEGSKAKVIEEEAFEKTQLKQLVMGTRTGHEMEEREDGEEG
jgi:hypothetical protein